MDACNECRPQGEPVKGLCHSGSLKVFGGILKKGEQLQRAPFEGKNPEICAFQCAQKIAQDLDRTFSAKQNSDRICRIAVQVECQPSEMNGKGEAESVVLDSLPADLKLHSGLSGGPFRLRRSGSNSRDQLDKHGNRHRPRLPKLHHFCFPIFVYRHLYVHNWFLRCQATRIESVALRLAFLC